MFNARHGRRPVVAAVEAERDARRQGYGVALYSRCGARGARLHSSRTGSYAAFPTAIQLPELHFVFVSNSSPWIPQTTGRYG